MNKQEILNQLHQHINACSEASLADAVMAFHEAIKLVEQLDENETFNTISLNPTKWSNL